ncbi:MAG: hypothetical protein N2235_10315, partial [Fischerella sp.]|nr:hypothetical protein [Fischerella sp.]
MFLVGSEYLSTHYELCVVLFLRIGIRFSKVSIVRERILKQWQELASSLEQLLQELRKKRHDIDTELNKQ